MKKFIYFLLTTLALGSCSKGGSDPAPSPTATASIVGKWEWESETLVSVFKDGRPTTTQNKTVVPGTVYLTFSTNGYYTVTTNGMTGAVGADVPLVVNVPITSSNKGYVVTKTLTELTPTHMTQVEVNEDNTVKYTTTDTYKR